MEGEPGILYQHIDAISFLKDGALLVGASSLTHRYWLGALFYYQNPDCAPDTSDSMCEKKTLANGVNALTVVPDSDLFMCGTDGGTVQVWRVNGSVTDEQIDKMEIVNEVSQHDDFITSLSLNSCSKQLLSSSEDCTIKVWDLAEGLACTRTYKAHSDSVNMVSWHHSNPHIYASCSQDGTMLLWDTRKSKPASYLDNQSLLSPATSLCWKPETEHMLAIGTETGEVLLQDTRRGEGAPVVKKLHNRPVVNLKFCPHNCNWLATASEDGRACVVQYHPSSAAEPAVIKEIYHKDFVKGLAWHPTTKKLYTSGWDSNVKSTLLQACNQDISQPSPSVLNSQVNGTDALDSADSNNLEHIVSNSSNVESNGDNVRDAVRSDECNQIEQMDIGQAAVVAAAAT